MEKIIALLNLMDNAQQSLPFTGPPARGGPTAGSSAGAKKGKGGKADGGKKKDKKNKMHILCVCFYRLMY